MNGGETDKDLKQNNEINQLPCPLGLGMKQINYPPDSYRD
jgi:hypothetical protein